MTRKPDFGSIRKELTQVRKKQEPGGFLVHFLIMVLAFISFYGIAFLEGELLGAATIDKFVLVSAATGFAYSLICALVCQNYVMGPHSGGAVYFLFMMLGFMSALGINAL